MVVLVANTEAAPFGYAGPLSSCVIVALGWLALCGCL